MRTVEAKISERLDRQINALVDLGWFDSRDKVLQEAIRRFLEAHRPELMERFIREDVDGGCVAEAAAQRKDGTASRGGKSKWGSKVR